MLLQIKAKGFAKKTAKPPDQQSKSKPKGRATAKQHQPQNHTGGILSNFGGLRRVSADMSDTSDEPASGWALSSWLRHITRYSIVLQHKQKECLQRWVCVASTMMRRFAHGLIRRDDRNADPVLHCFQSDGWSTLVTDWTTAQSSTGPVVTRGGAIKREFLKEVSIIKTIDVHRKIVGKIVMSASRPLDNGQSCWHIFQSSMEHFPLLRSIGFKGPSIFLALQDGLHCVAFGKHHAAYHDLFYSSDACSDVDEEEILHLHDTDLVFSFRCVGHVGSSAIRWGMARHSSEEIMKKLHVSTRALSSTSFSLRRNSSYFLLRHVRYVDASELPPWSERQHYWSALGVTVDMMDDFELVNPHWNPLTKTLSVSACLLDFADWTACLEKIMLYAYSWVTFSETRLGKTGPTGRHWMLSCSLGLDECFSEVMQDPATSKYYANGYLQADEETRLWLLIAGFAALPAEEMISQLLEDDRFFLRASQLKDEMDSETRYVSSMTEEFFAEVALVCGVGMSGKWIKHEVLLSMHISRGYVYVESFRTLEHDPWRLTQGDVEANSISLASQVSPPEERVTRQMWKALKCGWPPQVHTRCMLLLGDSPGTVMLSEKGHGFGAATKKRHQLLSTDKLIARSFGVETVGLTARDKTDVRIQQLEAKVQRMEEPKPSKLTNKQFFCSQLMKDREQGIKRSQHEALSDNRQCVAVHHQGWRELEPSAKLECAAGAAIENERRDLVAEVKLDHAREELSYAKRRKAMCQEQESGVINSLSGLRFTDDELARTSEQFYDSSNCSGVEMQEQWENLVRPPKTPDADVRAEFEEREVALGLEQEADEQPFWWRWMCQRRELFTESAIVFGSDMDVGYYFLFGKNQRITRQHS